MFKTSEDCQLELVSYSVLDAADSMHSEMDYMPASAARVSFGRENKTGLDPAADKKLMKYLADHQHMTPFEYQHAVFLIECPLFIRSQIHRHRTFSFNEISRRYTDENLEFWIPTQFRGQATNNRQASSGTVEVAGGTENWQHYTGVALGYYESLLSQGVAREQARAVLPQSLLTKFYMGGNLRNWAHFVELRREGHAQPEIRVVARRIHEKLYELWPQSVEVLLGVP